MQRTNNLVKRHHYSVTKTEKEQLNCIPEINNNNLTIRECRLLTDWVAVHNDLHLGKHRIRIRRLSQYAVHLGHPLAALVVNRAHRRIQVFRDHLESAAPERLFVGAPFVARDNCAATVLVKASDAEARIVLSMRHECVSKEINVGGVGQLSLQSLQHMGSGLT